MKVVGIIAEYNPFHNGHAWQIREAQRLAGADFCIIAMSGDFVQRGAPAVFDKYTRTRMALCAGADLVLEIPPVFACGSAEDYASCGVALLDRLGIVDALCFGSECGQTKPLMDLARILCREPEAYRKRLKEELKNGLSFPLARQKGISRRYGRRARIRAFRSAFSSQQHSGDRILQGYFAAREPDGADRCPPPGKRAP